MCFIEILVVNGEELAVLGVIEKVKCVPHDYWISGSDEIVTLDFIYQFVSEGSNFESPVSTDQLHTYAEEFSKNGKRKIEEV